MAEMSLSPFLSIITNKGQVHNSTLSGNTAKRISNNSSNTTTTNVNVITKRQIISVKKTSSNYTKSTYRIINVDADACHEIIYKFYVPKNVGVALARIKFGQICSQCPYIGFHVQCNALPSNTPGTHEGSSAQNTYLQANQTSEITIMFNVQPTMWHYVLLKFVSEDHFVKPFDYGIPSTKKNEETRTRYNVSFGFKIDYNESKSDKQRVTNSWKPNVFRNIELYPLLRQTYSEFFSFDYDLVPDENGTVPKILNLTAGVTSGFAFSIGEVYDIGGTLSFTLSMKLEQKAFDAGSRTSSRTNKKKRGGFLPQKFVGDSSLENNYESEDVHGNAHSSANKPLPRKNEIIIICMHYGEPGEPIWPDKCRYGRYLLPASSIINNTDSITGTGLIHVPFPESGQWFITMGLYCQGVITSDRNTATNRVKEFVKEYSYMLDSLMQSCPCAANVSLYKNCLNEPTCLKAMGQQDTLKIKECLIDSKCTTDHQEMTRKFEAHRHLVKEENISLENCSTSVMFTISSNPCVVGKCGRFGHCYHYMSGGFVFSTCVCTNGYRGWDCSDSSQVPSGMSKLLSSLLLIFSNLLFLPSIYIAALRKFYIEAIIYIFAMSFSIFYHACDSGEDEYSFCLVKLDVLQFCDFYCGLLSIWVTLLAMSHIRKELLSLLHMVGAILLAFATELNKQSLWAFLAPVLTGICFISASWGMHCYKLRKWFPARTYLMVYMPVGVVLVMMGLVCYAFLQTKHNYFIVHSIWHMVMALSIMCLLPAPKSFIPEL